MGLIVTSTSYNHAVDYKDATHRDLLGLVSTSGEEELIFTIRVLFLTFLRTEADLAVTEGLTGFDKCFFHERVNNTVHRG